ncbi:MAG TPA: DUF4962 domain-containing protein [Acidobacteriota bacterium]
MQFLLPPGHQASNAAQADFQTLLQKPVRLDRRWHGVHPRVFFPPSDLPRLRALARGERKQLWSEAIENLTAMRQDPPPPTPQGRRSQNDVAHAIAQISLAYAIEQRPEYLQAAKKWILAACRYDPWGYTFNKPNVDLAAGHLLYAIGWSYDLLYDRLTADERRQIREKLVLQSRLLYDYQAYKPGKRYAFSQNHTFIPMTGLMVASLALMDEVPEAEKWARLSHAVYDRVLQTLAPDGYYYEGFEYWVFSMPWIVHYLDALKSATGEDLYDQLGLRNAAGYFMHSMLPGARYIFDFGDVFEGPSTRAGIGPEAERASPGGRLHSNYHLLYRFAARFKDPYAQTAAQFARSHRHMNMEDIWTFLWYDPSVSVLPLDRVPLWRHFENAGVVFWRTGWDENATAIAFKCGPPEGHHAAALLKSIPEWELSTGHAHPDANSFILFAGGKYLSGDTGYSGITMTAHHNTLLVDNAGQERDGRHEVFADIPYDRLDQIRIVDFKPGADSMEVEGEAGPAYSPKFGLQTFRRRIQIERAQASGSFTSGAGRGNNQTQAQGARKDQSRPFLVITDSVSSSEPMTFSLIFQADQSLKVLDARTFEIRNDQTAAAVTIHGPEKFEISAEHNIVMAPGRPGSIEQGERQDRNPRLRITSEPTRRARFETSWVLFRKKD